MLTAYITCLAQPAGNQVATVVVKDGTKRIVKEIMLFKVIIKVILTDSHPFRRQQYSKVFQQLPAPFPLALNT